MSVGSIEVGPHDDVGLASPTHGFNFPPVTLAFMFAFPRTPWRNRVCILNTRGGVRLFGVYVPGLSGAAQLLAALVFRLKGYRVVGMRPVDLPSSWISLHPGLREDTIRAIYRRCEAVTRRRANRLLYGGRDLRALFDLPQDRSWPRSPSGTTSSAAFSSRNRSWPRPGVMPAACASTNARLGRFAWCPGGPTGRAAARVACAA